jgi:signal transduction histidine kinase
MEQASRDGRLGVSQSIRGRIADLGGTAAVRTAPGEGVEWELKVSR